MGDREKVAETLARSETLLKNIKRNLNVACLILLASTLVIVPCAILVGLNAYDQLAARIEAARILAEMAQKRIDLEAELAQKEAARARRQLEQKEAELAQKEAELAQKEAALARRQLEQADIIAADLEASVARVMARKSRRLAFEKEWRLANPDRTAIEMNRAYNAYERDWKQSDAAAKAIAKEDDKARAESAQP